MFGVLAYAAAAHFFQADHPGEFFRIDAVAVIDKAIGVGERDRLGAEMVELLDGILRHVARARNSTNFALETVAASVEHLLGKVNRAITGRLRAYQRSSPVRSFPGQRA